jgi:ABC-2 type transport system ATP-binding protein
MLQVKSVHYSYPHSKQGLLEDISLEVTPGHIYGLLGANGEGKSTLLYLIAGLLRPSCGRVLINNVDSSLRLPMTLADIFLVPEEIALPNISLRQYVKMNAQFYPNFSFDDLRRFLEEFRLDTEIHLGRLSMGQKKKAFVAFALACNTMLLLMDEPTNGLDIPGKADFRRAIVSAMNENRTIIISTHQVRDLDRVLDHLIIMANHKIVLNASMEEISEHYQFLTSVDYADCNGALFYETVPGGYNIIRNNTEGADSDVNLESLFNYIYSNPQTKLL